MKIEARVGKCTRGHSRKIFKAAGIKVEPFPYPPPPTGEK